jgi:hypothetical protein
LHPEALNGKGKLRLASLETAGVLWIFSGSLEFPRLPGHFAPAQKLLTVGDPSLLHENSALNPSGAARID